MTSIDASTVLIRGASPTYIYALCVVSVKDHHTLLHDLSLLKKACVRHVVLDKWFPLNLSNLHVFNADCAFLHDPGSASCARTRRAAGGLCAVARRRRWREDPRRGNPWPARADRRVCRDDCEPLRTSTWKYNTYERKESLQTLAEDRYLDKETNERNHFCASSLVLRSGPNHSSPREIARRPPGADFAGPARRSLPAVAAGTLQPEDMPRNAPAHAQPPC